MKKIVLIASILLMAISSHGKAVSSVDKTAASDKVETVYLIFKTHLDIGYTDFSCNVEKKYLENFIPKAIENAKELREAGGEERYVWTTGAWLIDSYLRQANDEDRKELEEAIARGDIHWNAMPYSIETESASKDLIDGMLGMSASLDRRFGKKTIAAKMTDVPGHTRSLVPILADHGIRMLHVGVNGCSTVPEVPRFFRWLDKASGKDVLVIYDSQYGGDNILPDGKTAVMISFTGDNEGPHSIESIKEIYAGLHEEYPNAKIVAGSLDDVALALEKSRDVLPVLTSEIGDTWIYGYASSPLKIARFRALSRLYSKWIEEGRIDPASEETIAFAVRLGLIAEHTWGSRGAEIGNFDTYDMDKFRASRNIPAFRCGDLTWKEQEEYVDQAVQMLPEPLKTEAFKELDAISYAHPKEFKESRTALAKADPKGRYSFHGCLLGGVSYQSYSKADYEKFQKEYVRVYNPGFDKVGLENVRSESHLVDAVPVKAGKAEGGLIYEMPFPETEGVDSRVYPSDMQVEYSEARGGLDMKVTILNKPAVRLPEAYWLSFSIDGIKDIIAEKSGSEVDLLDVVPGGNRRMHYVDGHVDVVTDRGTLRITPLDAPLLTIGERNGIGFTREMPDLADGIHFCLYDNLWSTNFNLWWEGSICYRFHIEYLEK